MSDRGPWGFERLEARHLLAAEPIITEFMASNSSTLEDGHGATPDWIEIHNTGDQAIDLVGYRLTDDPTDTGKWSFPNALLEAGGFLTVFASGNNAPDSAGNLHTNFALSANGEYLALIAPDGSLLSEFGQGGSDYPVQTTDISYGLAMDTVYTDAVTPNTSARYLIPSNNAVDATWTNPAFDDSSWRLGTTSIGYEEVPADYVELIQTTVPAGTTSVYMRMSFSVTDATTLLDKLQIKYDDGFIAYINGTRVASVNAPDTAVYNSIATADHPDELAVEYADFDLSGFSNLLNMGTNTLSIHIMNRSPSSDLLAVPNLVLTSGGIIEPQMVGSLASPTPGLPNTHLRASDVQFSRAGGVFVDSFQLAMVTTGAGELIRYTTDGTAPDQSSPLYTGPITVDSTEQFRARAYGPIGQVGSIQTVNYVQATSAVGNVTSNLPIIVLDNLDRGIPDREFQDSTFALYDVDPVSGTSSLSAPADVTSLSAQHRRGKSTYNQPKLNLRIELRDEFGSDKNEALLGMPSESDWILYAPWTIDRAMVRHAVMYDLSRQAGRWAPRTRYVEVYSNYDGGPLQTSDYVGVYVLMEVIKRDDERVDIAELTATQNFAPDITGGYILQIDEAEGADATWNTSRGYPTGSSEFVHVEPERIDMTQSQVDYLRGYVQSAEDALFGPNSADPNSGYPAYFDVESAIDFHIFNVFPANPDAFRLSTYLTKDRGGKLAYGPIWDFDRGMGPDEDDRAADPTVWMSDENYFWVTQYWNKMFDDPNFEQQWVDRWQDLRQTVFNDANIQATLASHTSQLTTAQARNAARWGSGIAPNGGPLADLGLTGWEGEISHLENWLLARANWIDTQMISRPNFGPDPGNVAVNTQVSMSAQSGAKIYYTLDGSDPRADGGGIKSGAMLYNGSIPITQSTVITARARASGDFFDGWSGPVTGLFSVEVPADATNLRITELHYHPAAATPAELIDAPGVEDDDFEFIELINLSDDTISLNGIRFIDGILFDFTTSSVSSLPPDTAIVVVENEAAFTARYGTEILIAGEYDGNLSNSGEQIVLVGINDLTIHDFAYSDSPPWPTIVDGGGPTLEVVDTSGDYGSSSNWRSSAKSNGTPGEVAPWLPGDYNKDNVVDTADYVLWRSTFGTTTDLRADGNRDNIVNLADYSIWRNNLGATTSSAHMGIDVIASSGIQSLEVDPITENNLSTVLGFEAVTPSAVARRGTSTDGQLGEWPKSSSVSNSIDSDLLLSPPNAVWTTINTDAVPSRLQASRERRISAETIWNDLAFEELFDSL